MTKSWSWHPHPGQPPARFHLGIPDAYVSAMARRMVPALILIDLSQTKHMSGMAFVVLSILAQQLAATRGRLAICRLDATLRVGAEIMGLSSGLDIYDDEAFALASF
jgi:anti-anti-sigma regulatory factor